MAHLLETRGLAIRLLRVIPSTDHLQSFHMYRDIIDSQNCLVSLTMTKVIEGIVWVFIRDWCSVEPSFMNIISTHLNDFKCPFKEPSKWTEAAFRVVCKNSLCPVHSWNWHYWDRLLMIIVYSLEKHSRTSGSQACLNPDPSSITSWPDELTWLCLPSSNFRELTWDQKGKKKICILM